jgi:hypothetical protein
MGERWELKDKSFTFVLFLMGDQPEKRYETAELIGRNGRRMPYKALLHDQSPRNFVRTVSNSKYAVTSEPSNYHVIEKDFLYAIVKEKPVYGARVIFPLLKMGDYLCREPEFVIATEMTEEMILGRTFIEDRARMLKLKELAERKKTPVKIRSV